MRRPAKLYQLLSKLFCLAALLSLITPTTSIFGADPQVYIRGNTTEISPGDTIYINIGLTEGDSIVSILAFLNYSEQHYSFLEGKIGALLQTPSFTDIHVDSSLIDYQVYLMAVILGEERYIAAPGDLFRLYFKVLQDTGRADFEIDSLHFYNLDLQKLAGLSETLITVISPDTFPPDPVADFKVLSGSAELTFSWRNPSDSDFKGTLILRSQEGYLDSVSTGATIAYQGNDSSFTDINLSNNTIYYYSAFTYDEVPNYSKPIFIKAEPNEEFVYAYPNPFNPNDQDVLIKAVLPNDAFIDLSIYDTVGNLVLDLSSNLQVLAGVPKIVRWDGKNGDGELVANGVYYLVVNTGHGGELIEKIAVIR